eukprot:CFRG7009T1
MSLRDNATAFLDNSRAAVSRWADKLKGSENKMSIEGLREAYNVIQRYINLPRRTDQDDQKVVEALKDMAEILVWGDQNNPSVFDFFLEKNLFVLFLEILNMKGEPYVKMQLLQCLNIIFENIRNESSLYYFMSNNYINNVITHKYDFSNEEILAYYISFLKTLSFRLTPSTILFFYNEHQEDFPLYSEAIKFFNHKESMVRIAVRTIVLNIFKVNDENTRNFVGDEEQAPYFSNLVWFIGNQSLELDECVRTASHIKMGKLSDLLAEHLDVLHYVNDIFETDGIEAMQYKLANRLLDNMLVPLYVYSLRPEPMTSTIAKTPRIAMVTALVLLAHIFSVFGHSYLLNGLAAEVLKVTGVEELRRTLTVSRTPSTFTISKGVTSGNDSGEDKNGMKAELNNDTCLDIVTDIIDVKDIRDNVSENREFRGNEEFEEQEDKKAHLRIQDEKNNHDENDCKRTNANANHVSPVPASDFTSKSTPKLTLTFNQDDATITSDNLERRIVYPLSSTAENTQHQNDRFDNRSTELNCMRKSRSVEIAPPGRLSISLIESTNEGTSAPTSPGLRREQATKHDDSVRRIRTFEPPLRMIESPVDSVPMKNTLHVINQKHNVGKGDMIESKAENEYTDNDDPEGLELTMVSMEVEGLSLNRENTVTPSANERVYRDAVMRAIDCTKDDSVALSALCFIYSVISSPLVDSGILVTARWLPKKYSMVESATVETALQDKQEVTLSSPTTTPTKSKELLEQKSPSSPALSQSMYSLSTMSYSAELVERAISVLHEGCKVDSNVRLATLHVATFVISELCYFEGEEVCLRPRHMKKLMAAHDFARDQLASMYEKHDSSMILNMVEEEYLRQKPIRMSSLLMQPSILLPATNTPMTGIDLLYRVPNGDVERCRKAVLSFLLIRKVFMELNRGTEDMLPLLAEVNGEDLLEQRLDLNDADLMSCRVIQADKPLGVHRFLVIDPKRFILVEPDKNQLGWGVVKVASDLQHVEITPDQGNHRVLHIVICAHPLGLSSYQSKMVLRVIFEDQMRAAAASQHLQHANSELQSLKSARLELLLGIRLPSDDI